MARVAGPLGPLLDLPEHVPRLEVLRERFLEDRESALAQRRVDIDALGLERIEDALCAVVGDADAKLAALEADANVRCGDRHFLFEPVVQRAGVVGRAELLYCRAYFFETIFGIHVVPPRKSIHARRTRGIPPDAPEKRKCLWDRHAPRGAGSIPGAR